MTKTLLFDIETAPNRGFTWGKYDKSVLAFDQPWYVLCFAYKWLGERGKPVVVGLPDYPDTYAREQTDDSLVVGALHALLDEADIVVGHNAKNFDVPKARARMIALGMSPPAPFKVVDTLQVARREFEFTSNSLKDVCKTLGLDAKGETGGFGLWLGCMDGDEKSWAKMRRYNQQDVIILEQLYNRLLPWIERHPNVALIEDRPEACPKCGADGTMQARGYAINSVSRRRRFQCQACGGWSLGRTPIKSEVKYY